MTAAPAQLWTDRGEISNRKSTFISKLKTTTCPKQVVLVRDGQYRMENAQLHLLLILLPNT